ncbi:MAG: hypothetical protein HON90_08400, partial [Halobacteriovoraceae bacterium]|nr:hypothetical protein [Halobacteriovoraceae bacterium]
FIPSFAPVFFNIVMILSMIIFPSILIERGMEPILSLGFGVLIGGFVQALVQFPMILKKGYGPTKPDKIFSKQTQKVLILLGPGLIGFAATQINLIVNTILASSTVVGAVSWLSFSFRLFQLPVGILSVSIGNSNLVHFSSAWKDGKHAEAKNFLASSYFLSFFLVVPAMIALMTCSEEMVNIIFERGKFDAHSTTMTAMALRFYAIGLPLYSIYKIFVPTFYAIDRQKIPVLCSIIGIVFNIIFCVLLTPIYGFKVLALGTTLSMFLNTGLQGIILRKDLSLSWSYFVNIRIIKIAISGALTATCIMYLKQFISFDEGGLLLRVSYLTGYLIFIASCYFFLCYLLGERAAVNNLFKRFLKTK